MSKLRIGFVLTGSFCTFSAAFAQAVRAFLVSLDGDFMFRRPELLLGFSFLRFSFLLHRKQFFDSFRRH